MLTRLARAILARVAPGTAAAWAAARGRAHSHRLFEEWGLGDLNRRLLGEVGSVVLAGPFRGLILTPMAHSEHIGPFLLGTYETELHPCWEALAGETFAQVVDVGAKFGYYAVGLARRYPEAPVVAFDIDPWARRATRQMSDANRTPNVTVGAACTPDWLARDLRPGALVVSDCEGYEGELFDRPLPAAFGTTTLVIETHDGIRPGVTAALRGRFAGTHAVELVAAAEHRPAAEVAVRSLTPAEVVRVGQEVRGPQAWLVCRPHDRTAGGGPR